MQLNDITVNLYDGVENTHKLTSGLNYFEHFQLLLNGLVYRRSDEMKDVNLD